MRCLAQNFVFPGTSHEGFRINSQRNNSINISHQIKSIKIIDKKIILNNFNIYEDSTPSLPSNSHYVLVPNDVNPKIDLISFKKKSIDKVELIHNSKDKFDISDIYKISDTINIRGFNFVLLNITPFHYDKINKCLDVFYDINLEITYDVRSISYGNDRYRDKDWDDILRNMALNHEVINDFDYDNYVKRISDDDFDGCQYLIVTPDNHGIRQWADTLARFRNEQGILTKLITLDEIGDNYPMEIKKYFKESYNNWDLVPAAILLFGDYSLDATKGIASFYLDDHPEKVSYLADNRLVDFNDDNLPEIVIARIPAEDARQAELMVKKTIRYETSPSANPDYYNKPVTAAGYEESKWFQLCSEVIAGYFEKNGRHPNRLNSIFYGNPDSVWSTASNTDVIIDFFGPDGLDYIPYDIRHLVKWDASQNDICDAINKGTFLIQYRGHGEYQAWTKPHLSNKEISKLENEELTFIMSSSCRTGNFCYGGGHDDCFAERFMRTDKGCVAIIAASETSYSFVNDTYVWGCYDYLWNDFMPSYGNKLTLYKYPAFANTNGKYFLKQSSWPDFEFNKNITYDLFHYFGDAFLKLNTEMPQNININYPNEISDRQTSIIVSKDDDVRLCLSVDGRIIAVASDNDSIIDIEAQRSGTRIKVVASKQDYYRHEGYIHVKSDLYPEELNVYPNPTRGQIYIESIGIKHIDVYNNIGQKVKEINNRETLSEKILLDCSTFKKGLFHLHIIYEDKTINKTVVII